MPDGPVKERLISIYARICEGYRVLTSAERRVLYDKGLATGKVRWDSKDREQKGPKNPEDSINHPEAKKFFRMGMMCVGKKDWKGAVMNFNFARTFDSSSKIIAEKLAETQAMVKSVGTGK
jgi:hypothetical protein